MKRKLIFFTFVLTALLTTGCTRTDPQRTENNSSPVPSQTNPSTDSVHSTEQSISHTVQNTDTANRQISEEEARQIALDRVPGATEQDIREFHSDYDNGKHHYEGKIHYKDTEYEFEIESSNGTILEWNEEPIHSAAP